MFSCLRWQMLGLVLAIFLGSAPGLFAQDAGQPPEPEVTADADGGGATDTDATADGGTAEAPDTAAGTDEPGDAPEGNR